MKDNSKKLLLWLYPTDLTQPRRRVGYEQIELILPELTEHGRQSLVRLLERSDLLFTDRLGDQLNLSLSTHGKSQLEAQFPALARSNDPWQGDWYMIVFLQSPNSDKNFRYLRPFLLKEHCIGLERGTYLHAGQLSEAILSLLQKSYRSNVIIVKFDNLQFGDELNIIGQKVGLEQLVNTYSGIGREIQNLLTKKLKSKSLSDQQKKTFCSVYDRLFSALENDFGIILHYFPQVDEGFSLLHNLQTSIS